MTGRTRPCDDAVIHGRLRKAEQFWEAAEITREFADDEAEVGDAYGVRGSSPRVGSHKA
jgi:hypothetical protein